MRTFFRDCVIGLRLLKRAPGQALIAILAIGLGLGLASTLFTVLQGTYFRRLPFEDPSSIVRVEQGGTSESSGVVPVSREIFLNWLGRLRSFEGLAAWFPAAFSVSRPGAIPMRFNGAYLTPSAFQLLRIQPVLGRNLTPADALAGAEPVVLVSDRLWRSLLQGDPKALGRPISLYGEIRTVAGVLPPGLRFPYNQDLWIPLAMDSGSASELRLPLQVFGRLRRGVSLQEAAAELENLSGSPPVRVLVSPYVSGYSDPHARTSLVLMLGAALLVLLIACANVANLLAVRLAHRAREIGIRVAVGATRGRLLIQFLAEAAVIAVPGLAVGLALTRLGAAAFRSATRDQPQAFWVDVSVDARSTLFLLGLAALVIPLYGLIPGFRGARLDRGGRPAKALDASTVGRFLVLLQIVLACALLSSQALLLRSVFQVRSLEMGFQSSHIVTTALSLFGTDFPDSASQARAFDEIVRRWSAIPGVERIGVTTDLPGDGIAQTRAFLKRGDVYKSDSDYPQTQWAEVDPEFFASLALRPKQGRVFDSSDRSASQKVAVVNESFARRHYPGRSALGQQIALEDDWLTIVGVVPDLLMGGLDSAQADTVFRPLSQSPSSYRVFLIRTRRDVADIAPLLQQAAARVAPQQALDKILSMDEVAGNLDRPYRLAATVFSIAGLAAGFLSLVGVFGIASFSLSRRARDLVMHLVLGASRPQAVRAILQKDLMVILAGVVLGLAVSAALTRFLVTFLYGAEGWDPKLALLAAISLAVTALLASIVPAHQILRRNPAKYLHTA